MPTIKIDDLHPTGAELFSDSESYMNELGDGELDLVMGGMTTPICRSIARSVVKSVVEASKAVSRASRAMKDNPKGAGKKVSRFVGSGVTWELSIQLSNPFNSF